MPIDDNVFYVDVGIDILEELPVEECPTCGHMSLAAAMATMTLNGVPQNVGKYTRCAEGCDDEPRVYVFTEGEHDSSPCSTELLGDDDDE